MPGWLPQKHGPVRHHLHDSNLSLSQTQSEIVGESVLSPNSVRFLIMILRIILKTEMIMKMRIVIKIKLILRIIINKFVSKNRAKKYLT